MANNRNDYIKYYIEGGKEIFPCAVNGKKPITNRGYKDASSNPDQISIWWKNHPDANIGLVTGEDANLVVVDVDVKNNAGGLESLDQLQDECGQFDTLMVHSPSGGRHYYFSYPQGNYNIRNKANLRPGIDIRANGGYIIAPGSSINDKPYYFDDKYKDIAELPEKLLKILIASNAKPKITTKNLDGIKENYRDDTIFSHACSLRGKDIPYETAKLEILDIAHNCNPAFPDDEAIKCLDSAYRYEPNSVHRPTDVGNAKRLVAQHGEDIRYVYEYKTWIYWKSNIWIKDKNGHMSRLAKKVADSIYNEYESQTDENIKKTLKSHAISSESKKSLKSMVDVASTECSIPISQSVLDNDKYLLGVKNGTIDLRTGTLILSTKKQMITKRANVEFDAEAKCPLWEKSINQMMAGDQDVVEYLQKAVGYSLTGDTSEQLLFFLYGYGENGKSVFIKVIQTLLADYAMQTPVATIMNKAKGNIPNDIARLNGARLVATSETEEGSRLNNSEIKHITGGDVVTARFLKQEFFEFVPQFKLWISGNHKPILGEEYGIWRRFVLIPFEVRFDKTTRDNQLEDKLLQELPGILNWAIKGCLKLQKLKLTKSMPKKIAEAIKEYKTENDRIESWSDEYCMKNPTSRETSTELYQSFKKWAVSNGEQSMSHRVFSTKMVERGYAKKRNALYLMVLSYL